MTKAPKWLWICVVIGWAGFLFAPATGHANGACSAVSSKLPAQLDCAAALAGHATDAPWAALIERMRADAVVVPQNNFHSRRTTGGAVRNGGEAAPMPPPPQPALSPTPGQVLAPADEEVFAGRIGWHVNDSATAFKHGLAKDKLTVLVLGKPGCRWCTWLVREVLPCAAIDRFAGRAVFAYSEPSDDAAARAIAQAMNIRRYPVTVFIEPDARRLTVPAHIGGFFSGHRFSKIMEKYFERTQAWQRPAPSIAQTNQVRAENGLTPPDPAPRACQAMPIWMK